MRNQKNVSDSLKDRSHTFFGDSSWLLYVCVIGLFALGIGFRLYNLTNPPLDDHAWRQLASASLSRAMYYQMLPNADPVLRQKAIALAPIPYEPPITEKLVALSYLAMGGEYLWIFRIWTTLFWVVGGLALFALVRRMSSVDGAVIALGYYLLLPFGNATTREFLPEPLMVMWIILALYATHRWVESSTWRWAVAAGVFSGLAVLTKVFAVFPLTPALILVALATFGFRRTITNLQFWVIVALAAIIPAAYYIFPNPQSGADYISTWVFPYTHLLLDITFYISWLHHINGYFNLAVVLMAVASIILLEKRWRAMCFGLWIGYGLLGAAVPELVYSHIYYSLPLVAIVGISLGPIGALLSGKLHEQGKLWQALFLAVALVAVGYSIFMSRKAVKAVDYRVKVRQYEDLARKLPDSGVIGLIEDYGWEFKYYGWKHVDFFPYTGDHDMGRLAGHDFNYNDENLDYFNHYVGENSYFVVTMFDQLEAQPFLEKILYDRYTVNEQGDWYVIFDLTHPKPSG